MRAPQTMMKKPAPRPNLEGAAMLVVLMVLLMATATATFAIHATSMEMRAAGHARQAMQTRYVAEGGTHAALAYIDAINPRAAMTMYDRTIVPTGIPRTPGAAVSGDVENVLRIRLNDFSNTIGGVAGNAPPIERDLARVPSYGPNTGVMAGSAMFLPDFIADGTDRYRSNRTVAGRDMTGSSPVHYVRMNLTTRGTMTPQSDSIVAGDPRSYHESAVTARAMIEIGPLPD